MELAEQRVKERSVNNTIDWWHQTLQT